MTVIFSALQWSQKLSVVNHWYRTHYEWH